MPPYRLSGLCIDYIPMKKLEAIFQLRADVAFAYFYGKNIGHERFDFCSRA